MKYISIPVYLNRFIFIVTGILYLTIFMGLYAQIILGIYQLIVGSILLFFVNKMPVDLKKRLINYWISVLAYGTFYLLTGFEGLKDFGIVIIVLIPLTMAGYFTYILESLKKRKHENRHT